MPPGPATSSRCARGNVSNAERGWSAVEDGHRRRLPSQRRRRALRSGSSRSSRARSVHAVSLNYLPVNIAPVVDEIVVMPGARVNQQAQFQQPVPTVMINLPSASANVVNIQQDASDAAAAGGEGQGLGDGALGGAR